jgi:hypothetical protein
MQGVGGGESREKESEKKRKERGFWRKYQQQFSGLERCIDQPAINPPVLFVEHSCPNLVIERLASIFKSQYVIYRVLVFLPNIKLFGQHQNLFYWVVIHSRPLQHRGPRHGTVTTCLPASALRRLVLAFNRSPLPSRCLNCHFVSFSSPLSDPCHPSHPSSRQPTPPTHLPASPSPPHHTTAFPS